jgi:septal ring factor EnvC (AmiA/AmiB activator)
MKKILFISLCLITVQAAFAQKDKAQMERERQELQQELKEIQANYSKVKGQQKVTIGQLNILQNKMHVQERYVGNINNEIKLLSDDIYISNVEITRLQRQLDTLKAEYAKSLVYAYKNNNSYDYINFIFSASNFNDALRRIAYLRAYRAYNEEKVETIGETQSLIVQRKQQLLGKTSQKKSALQNQQSQLNELENQKKEKAQVVSKLKSQANNLSNQIAIKKKRDKQLKGQIAAIVRREIEKALAEERKRLALEKAKAPNNTTTTSNTGAVKKVTSKKVAIPLNEGETKLAASFERNRGGLPWPVDNGFVSIPYGTSNVDGLLMDNPGITISTPSAGGTVKSVFDGEVSSVSNTGEGMMVMIRHGRYFTVYSNLSSASVNRGDVVRTGQSIGRTAGADDGTGGQVDFILMVESKNVNPRPWLR